MEFTNEDYAWKDGGQTIYSGECSVPRRLECEKELLLRSVVLPLNEEGLVNLESPDFIVISTRYSPGRMKVSPVDSVSPGALRVLSRFYEN